MDIRIKIAGFIAMSALATSAFAVDEGFYVGGQLGESNNHNTVRTIPNGGAITNTVQPTNTGMGARILMGYVVGKYAAFELGYAQFAKSSYKAPPSIAGQTDPAIRGGAIDFSGKAMYTTPYGVGVFAKAGLAYMRFSQSGNLSPAANNGGGGTTTGVRPLAGLGVSYDITQSWVTDLSYTRYISRGTTIQPVDFIALGLTYHIVNVRCGQFLC